MKFLEITTMSLVAYYADQGIKSERPVVGYDQVLVENTGSKPREKYVICVANDKGEIVHANDIPGYQGIAFKRTESTITRILDLLLGPPVR